METETSSPREEPAQVAEGMPLGTAARPVLPVHAGHAAVWRRRWRRPWRRARVKSTRGLLLIGAFKLLKAAAALTLAFATMHLIHRNIGDLVMRFMYLLPINPAGRISAWMLDQADLLDTHHLRQFGALTLGYAVVCMVEGIGLMRCKVWAEYLTLTLTMLGLPWEIFEMFRHFLPYKALVFGANLVVVLYLVWLLRRKKRRHGRHGAAATTC